MTGGGVIGYRAPEMALGLDHSYPVDLFSMGCLMHLMLTGQPLYTTEEAEHGYEGLLVENLQQLSPDPPSPAALSLMAHMLAKDQVMPHYAHNSNP